jgi:hypothetical protein
MSYGNLLLYSSVLGSYTFSEALFDDIADRPFVISALYAYVSKVARRHLPTNTNSFPSSIHGISSPLPAAWA